MAGLAVASTAKINIATLMAPTVHVVPVASITTPATSDPVEMVPVLASFAAVVTLPCMWSGIAATRAARTATFHIGPKSATAANTTAIITGSVTTAKMGSNTAQTQWVSTTTAVSDITLRTRAAIIAPNTPPTPAPARITPTMKGDAFC